MGKAGNWALGVCVLIVSFITQTSFAQSRPVTFRADDGHMVSGVLMEAALRPAPAVVLVGMLGRPKEDWQFTMDRLAIANITSLAIDLRGQLLPEDPKAGMAWHLDVTAAVAHLASRADVRAWAIGVAGASLGANLAAVAAAADPRVRSLALISPSLDYRGIRTEAALRQYGGRPALLLASLRDPYAARSARELAVDAPGIRELLWAETAAHGTMLLAREPDLIRGLVEWFQRTLA
jgi:alpha-beta hydrolase superfamily lysophospholipase